MRNRYRAALRARSRDPPGQGVIVEANKAHGPIRAARFELARYAAGRL